MPVMLERTPQVAPMQALSVFALVVLLLVGLGPALAPLGIIGLALAQLLIIGAVPVAVTRLGGVGAREGLGMAAPSARSVAGAVLVGASFWLINLALVVPLVLRHLGGSEELEQLERHLIGDAPLLATLVVVAVLPAVCEELLLRGLIARAFAARFGVAFGVISSALLFGLLHLSIARFPPTALLGVVLAWAALAAGSVVPAMIIHFLNNFIAILLAGGHLSGLAEAIEAHPTPLVIGAAAATGAGLYLLRGNRPSPARRPQ
jgi:membrane protease YdiL (CAAX protease family)